MLVGRLVGDGVGVLLCLKKGTELRAAVRSEHSIATTCCAKVAHDILSRLLVSNFFVAIHCLRYQSSCKQLLVGQSSVVRWHVSYAVPHLRGFQKILLIDCGLACSMHAAVVSTSNQMH